MEQGGDALTDGIMDGWMSRDRSQRVYRAVSILGPDIQRNEF